MDGILFGAVSVVAMLIAMMKVSFKPGCNECREWQALVAEKKAELRAARRGNRAEL